MPWVRKQDRDAYNEFQKKRGLPLLDAENWTHESHYAEWLRFNTFQPNWARNMKMAPPVDLDHILKYETINFTIGSDGLPYAVFPDNGYSCEYHDEVGGCGIANFGQYENAVCLQNTIGL